MGTGEGSVCFPEAYAPHTHRAHLSPKICALRKSGLTCEVTLTHRVSGGQYLVFAFSL